MEWVEVRGKSVDIAVEAALRELGIDDRRRAEVEVLQEPERGFLGMGGKDAIVRVKPKPAPKKRRRRRRKGKGGGDEASDGRGERESGKGGSGDRSGGGGQGRGSGGDRKQGRNEGRSGQKGQKRDQGGGKSSKAEVPDMEIDQQAPVVEEFLQGLVKSFGLEGSVDVSVDDETIVADVSGPQTEAMVGPRGAVIEAIHELSKTVLQRQTQSSARVRLDIAGYAERRRQALRIYADQLIDQVLEEQAAIELEPMSASDRKVIHDAVAARDGVRSQSEGESPRRFVVISLASGGSDEEE